MESIDGNALRGHLEGIILAVLERAPAHGFEVVKRLEEDGRGVLALRESTIYPILYRLERRKLLRSVWDGESTPSGGPRRRVYHLTPGGRRELAKRRNHWTHFVTTVGRLLEAPE